MTASHRNERFNYKVIFRKIPAENWGGPFILVEIKQK